MKSVGASLFAPSRKRRWFDVADVRIAADAEYVAEQDAYRVSSARSGYAQVKPIDAEAKGRADAEYTELKTRMRRTTAISGAIGAAVAGGIGGLNIAYAFGLGACASIGYLLMLQGSVDYVGGLSEKSEGEADSLTAAASARLASRFFGARFIVPVLPFVILGATVARSRAGVETRNGTGGTHLAAWLGSVPREQAAAIVLGLLTYKVPLLAQTAGEAVDSLAEVEVGTGTTGMLGTAAALAARTVKKQRIADGLDNTVDDGSASSGNGAFVFVFAGPSGAGKSTLISRLFAKFPDVFDFSVSHTTRKPRESETEGVEYSFTTPEEFQRMIEADEFVEHATVHGNSYGTSYAAIEAVLDTGRACVLDLDVQGVETLSKRENMCWSPRFVWVAPPSMEALEQRLSDRGTETEETLANRLDTATREMTYAATNNVFDLTIINDDIDAAGRELTAWIQDALER
jgi:guanylate kinase